MTTTQRVTVQVHRYPLTRCPKHALQELVLHLTSEHRFR